MKIFSWLVAAFWFLSGGACAYRGVVVDAVTRQPIADASVTLGDAVVRTAASGGFRIDGRGAALGVRGAGYGRRRLPLAGFHDGETVALVPFRPKALYLSFYGIGDARIRQAALDVAGHSAVNSLVIDVKGDRGMISYRTDVPLAARIGAQKIATVRNLRQLLHELHQAGFYVIGRIVVFKDDVLAAARPDLALGRARGGIWRDREGSAWIDPFKTQAWDYDIDVAVDAARNGFDEIQFDYVRFPDAKGLMFSRPDTQANRVAAITGFLAEARRRLTRYNVFLAADVFGYTVWNTDDTGIGQDLPALAREVDYVSPMLYPSGFQYGIPGYADPVRHPYEIVIRSLRMARKRTGLPPVRFRPWLQAFRDYAFGGQPFGGPEIAAQIAAARDFGSDGWMLWDPKNVYSTAGLPPRPDAADGPRSGPPADPAPTLRAAALSGIAPIVAREIRAGRVPGAVVVVGNAGRIVYRRAFGDAALRPRKIPMTVGTVFDLASLTKVVATTTAVMQLVDAGKLDLDAPVARYWPAFAANGKAAITLRELLTHYSGLAPDLNLRTKWKGYGTALRMIAAERPRAPPGSRYCYSDINFEVLGEVVRRVAGEPLDAYCAEHIFRPLRMRHTEFRPPASWRSRIAPTAYVDGALRWGAVHDPTAWRMGGVSGHAGLFSDADDLARFAQALLDGGALHGVRVLDRAAVAEMTVPQSPPGKPRLRGLGWDLAAPFASDAADLPPIGAYDHTGFTGTMLWIDPVSRTFLIVLTNRVHPFGGGDARPLRKALVQLVSAQFPALTAAQVVARRPALARADAPKAGAAVVRTGIDVLEAERFAPLRGLRIGLITNQTGVDARGVSTIALLSRAPGVHLAAIFSPEHGLRGVRDGAVRSGRDPDSGLPVYSLYGTVRRPTREMLRGIDALVFDVQDAGARFYTYITTMAYAMAEAGRRNMPFYVLDRPDPIDAAVVQGPVLDGDLESFTGYFPLPVRYGMTMGELAGMFNAQDHLGVRLHVVRMQGYRRSDWFDQTRIRWVDPSPNLRSLAEETLYPGVALVEGANVSVGRGTPTPFEVLGAPWVRAGQLSRYLDRRKIPGVHFAPATFTPAAGPYAGRRCQGVRIAVVDRDALDAPSLGVELASALTRLYPAQFRTDRTLGMVGSRPVLAAIERGEDPRRIAASWQQPLARFEGMRARYLLYP